MKAFFIMLGNRIKELVAKMFSVKGLVFGIGTWLAIVGAISEWAWVGCAGLIIGGRAFEKYFAKREAAKAKPDNPTQGVV